MQIHRGIQKDTFIIDYVPDASPVTNPNFPWRQTYINPNLVTDPTLIIDWITTPHFHFHQSQLGNYTQPKFQ